MSFTIPYYGTGKNIVTGGVVTQVYGKTSFPSSAITTDSVTTNEDYFDCDGFDYNSEYVLIYIAKFKNTSGSTNSIAYRVELQANVNGTWESWYAKSDTVSLSNNYVHVFARGFKIKTGEIYSTASEYRIRLIVGDSSGSSTEYSYFDVDNVDPSGGAGITLDKCTIGKTLTNSDNSTSSQFYGKQWGITTDTDFGYADGTTGGTTFDLTGFGPSHVIGVCNLLLDIGGGADGDTVEVGRILQQSVGGEWVTKDSQASSSVVEGGYKWSFRYMLIIDPNYVWTESNVYRLMVVRNSPHGSGVVYRGFTISNLSVIELDYTEAENGCMRVEGNNIRYTVAIGLNKRTIITVPADGEVGTYVGTQYAGSVWLPDTGITEMKKIYYVSQSGYVKHTQIGELKYRGETSSPGQKYNGYMRIASYLTFINNGKIVHMGPGDAA